MTRRAMRGRWRGTAPSRLEPSLDAREKALQLVREGFAYPCYCSEQELQAMRSRQRIQGQAERYDRRCLSLYAEHRADYEAAGRRPAIRFRVPEALTLEWRDRLQGTMKVASDRLEDFVILEADGTLSRTFARVLDRSAHGVTTVMRDEAHVLETARELLLGDALGLPDPTFAHRHSRD